jgi:hypothetical protein
MAGAPVPTYQQFWADKRASLKTASKGIIAEHPDAAASLLQVFKVLCDIEGVAGFTPTSFGDSAEWAAIVSSVEDNRESYCQVQRGKPLFSALYGTYTVTINDLKSVLKASSQAGQTKQADGFKEVRSRKRH